MGNLNGIDANKMANAIENKIMQVAHQVLKNSPSDREVEGRVISRNQYNQYTIVINNYVYKNILQERSLGPISNGTIVKVKVPNNQMSNAYICGVVDGSIQTLGGGGTGGTTNYQDLENKPVSNTTHTTSQTPLSNEVIDGTINFHKISKTGALADTIQDSTHRTVTDAEKTNWNSKLGATDLLGIEGDIDELKTKTTSLTDSYNELYGDISDLETNKQPTLVSGTNIKTINGETILGSGNIEIQGGGSGESVALTQNANTIISAPANFITYSGSVVTVKSGTRVVIPNGLNADGSPNNLDYTLPADATFDISNYANDRRYIAIQKDGTLTTLMHPYGSDYYRVYYQYFQPAMDRTYGRWFDMTNNVWKTTSDSGATWTELYCCPVGAIVINSGVITSLTKHKVPTDFSFTEMDKLYADMKEQDLTRNINNTITNQINTFSMLPNAVYSTVEVTLGQTVTAPCTGYAFLIANIGSSSGAYASIYCVARGITTQISASANSQTIIFIPVVKGDSVGVYWGGVTSANIKFVSAQTI